MWGYIGIPAVVLPVAAAAFLLHGRCGVCSRLPFFVRAIWAVCCLAVLFGGLRIKREAEISAREQTLCREDETASVEATLLARRKTEYGVEWTLKDGIVSGSGREENVRRLLVYVEEKAFPAALPGNRVRVAGTLELFAGGRNPGEFDARSYYRAARLNCRMSADRWEVVGTKRNLGKLWTEGVRGHASAVLNRIAGEDAGIYRAAILGDRSGLEREVKDMYQRSGIAHLLAISGLHVSLIGMGAYGIFRKLGAGFWKAGAAGSVLVSVYAVMAGGSPSVLRASLMLACGFLAVCLGRTYDLLSALGLSAILILWENPYLVTQAGVQLSFGAVFGIGLVAPELEGAFLAGRLANRENMQRAVRGFLCSLSVQLMTAPVILYHYFQIPLYGIFLNLIVIPLMGIVVASGIGGILLGTFSLRAGMFAVGAGNVVLDGYGLLCRFTESLPANNLVMGRPEVWQIAVYYTAFILSVWLMGREILPVRRLLCLGAVLVCSLLPLPVRGLTVTFLDVGQGDGVCLRTGSGVILIDGGSSDVKKLGEYRLEPFLKSQAVTEITYAYVSHGDADHISGLKELLETSRDIAVRHLMLPILGQTDPACLELEELALKRGAQVHWIKAGDFRQLGGLSVSCIYPETPSQVLDRNAQSSVLYACYGDFGMLLTGDMGEDQEADVMFRSGEQTPSPKIQVLKIAHHGSRYSTSKTWLSWCRPVWAVVSSGESNSYGHPSEEVLNRLEECGIELYRTDRQGAIQLWTDGKVIRWKSFL